MLTIQQITTDPLQQQNLILPDGSTLSLTLYYRPLQQGWFINQLSWNSFVLNGLRITNNLNMLNQWRNILTFGLRCVSNSTREPSLQTDFADGSSTLYILTQAEVAGFATYLATGAYPSGT